MPAYKVVQVQSLASAVLYFFKIITALWRLVQTQQWVNYNFKNVVEIIILGMLWEL